MRNVLERILLTVEQHGDRPALEVGDAQWTYRQLWNAAATVAEAVRGADLAADGPVTLFSARQMETYAALLGIVMAGRPYLPVNIKFPPSRASRIVDKAESDIFVVSAEFMSLFCEFMDGREGEAHVITFEQTVADEVKQFTNVKVTVLNLTHGTNQVASLTLPKEFARFVYILFTSGTTGEPKGIPISHSNLSAYLDHILASYDMHPEDRCSQAFDITFDPSVHDIFVTWSVGACLCPLSQADLLLPNRFITSRRLTVWYSVPSIAMRMKQVRMLKAGAFPELRFSIFAGEALPVTIASAWQQAAPNSRVINMYGPTETTIIISAHEWDEEISPELAANGIAPIGRPFPSFSYVIRTSTGERYMEGETGELLVAGPQVCDGYLRDAVRTNESFIQLPLDEHRTWYCTGDIVREVGDGVLQYFGRVDEQVKIRGYRVEPVEIAKVIREHPEVIEAVVLPLRDEENLTVGIRAWVLAESSLRTQEVMTLCKERLPNYMVPDRIIQVASFPVNESGKIDRIKLYGVS